MELKDFYRSVESIVLFTGSVDDLNRMERLSAEARYELMPVKGSTKYLTGHIIPGVMNAGEYLSKMSGVLDSEPAKRIRKVINDLGVSEKRIKSTEQKAMRHIEETVKKLFGGLESLQFDLRIKAKNMGADGLVYVQLFGNNEGKPIYSGVPVKKVNG